MLRRSTAMEAQTGETLSMGLVSGLLDLLDTLILVCDRVGRILLITRTAADCLYEPSTSEGTTLNLFAELLHVDPKVIIGQLESGEHEVDLQVTRPSGTMRARIECIPELD